MYNIDQDFCCCRIDADKIDYKWCCWKEKKITPDKWEFTYATNKRRAWQAPEGSGVPVGTEYHWYLLAHQNVRKLDANSYTTSMEGLKYNTFEELIDQLKKEIAEVAR